MAITNTKIQGAPRLNVTTPRAATSWRDQPQPPALPVTQPPAATQPPAPAKPAPAWGGNQTPGTFRQDRTAELYQRGMKPTVAAATAKAEGAALDRRWREAPKVNPLSLINPSGAKLPGIPAPDQQAGPGPKINRLTGKPFGWRAGVPEPKAGTPAKRPPQGAAWKQPPVRAKL